MNTHNFKFREAHISKTKSLSIAFIIFILFVIAPRTFNNKYQFWHPDEIIPIEVVRYMYNSGDLDTNWKNADLPKHFKYNQYNFSSYNYACYIYLLSYNWVNGLINKSNIFNSQDIKPALRNFSTFLGIVSGILVFIIAYKLGSGFIAFLSLMLFGLTPILVQDCRYARPEAFVTFLLLLSVITGEKVYQNHR